MPTRSTRFTRSLVTGYGGLVVNILISLVSVPLALTYLSNEEFGLWALALQINGYLALIDFGMSGAVGRFLTDHKDDVNGAAYQEHFSTGFFVFLSQGLIVMLLGMGFSFFASELLSIPKHLSADFDFLLRALCVVAAISIATRALGSPLWAFQRMDVVNLGGLIGLVIQFFTMWLGFHLGFGVRSFVAACACPVLVAVVIYAYMGHRNRYFPKLSGWFRPRRSIFKEIFAFGRDGMLLAIGSQLVNATQITIVSRTLGLDAAASFSVATKVYGMSLVIFHKVVESAAPGLAEMYVRGEIENFVRRYWDVILLTSATAIVGAVALTAGNSAFVLLWTSGKVNWSLTGDVLLGLMILVSSMSRCFMAVFGVTKNLKPIRIIYFVEGIIFVPTAILAARWFGIEGLLAASLVVHVVVTLSCSARAATKILGSYRRLVAPLLLSVFALSMAATVAFLENFLKLSAIPRLALACGPVLIAMLIAWQMMIPADIRKLITSKIPRPFGKRILS